MLPLLLNLASRRVVVVGGGPVGRRRTEILLSAGASVRLICREPRPADLSAPRLEWFVAEYDAAWLDGAILVLAAGPPELNEQIVRDARARGLLVNSASDPESSDFQLPATARRGPLCLAVSTGGVSPHLARKLCDRLAGDLDPRLETWLDLLGEMREAARRQIADATTRGQLLASLADWHWLDRLNMESVEAVRAAMHARLREALRPPGRV
jgi:precorrin-2 dehydrogenase/sirohydrochlorin ferrochelatase